MSRLCFPPVLCAILALASTCCAQDVAGLTLLAEEVATLRADLDLLSGGMRSIDDRTVFLMLRADICGLQATLTGLTSELIMLTWIKDDPDLGQARVYIAKLTESRIADSRDRVAKASALAALTKSTSLILSVDKFRDLSRRTVDYEIALSARLMDLDVAHDWIGAVP